MSSDRFFFIFEANFTCSFYRLVMMIIIIIIIIIFSILITIIGAHI